VGRGSALIRVAITMAVPEDTAITAAPADAMDVIELRLSKFTYFNWSRNAQKILVPLINII